MVGGRILCRARRARDAHVGDPAVAERGERGAREATSADEQHRMAAQSVIRLSARSSAGRRGTGPLRRCRSRSSPARRLRGALEEALELGVVVPRFGRARASGEPGRRSPSPTTTDSSPDATADRCPATALPCTNPKVVAVVGLEAGDQPTARIASCTAVTGEQPSGIEVEVGLEAVAGGHDDRPAGRHGRQDARCCVFRVRRKDARACRIRRSCDSRSGRSAQKDSTRGRRGPIRADTGCSQSRHDPASSGHDRARQRRRQPPFVA